MEGVAGRVIGCSSGCIPNTSRLLVSSIGKISTAGSKRGLERSVQNKGGFRALTAHSPNPAGSGLVCSLS